MSIPDKTSTSRSSTYGPGLLPDFPRATPTLLETPGFQDQEKRYQEWWNACRQQVSYVVNKGISESLKVTNGSLQAQITEEKIARIDGDTALASAIATVSATANGKSKISVQSSAPSSPVLNDLWIDTSDNNKAKYWSGSTWLYKQDGVLAAAVSTEATARATADGFLEGKYTLTVVAGNVVTGMNITSSSGGGTNVSSVIFQADKFHIYSGTTAQTMFVADAIQNKVRLANVLTVDATNSSVYIKTTSGAGSYNSSGTPFYVDATGIMSLGNKLSWNGSVLAVTGTIVATASIFDNGGTAGNYVLIDSSGFLTGSSSSAGQIIIANSGGQPRLNLKYNGNTYGTWTISSTKSSMQLSDNASGSITIDPSGGSGAISIFGGGVFIGGSSGLTTTAVDISANVTLGSSSLLTWNGDTNLYRASANVLKTDDSLTVTGALVVSSGISGSGASITSINASNISSGTLSNSFLPVNISVQTLALSSSLTMNVSSGGTFDQTNGTVTGRLTLNNGTNRINFGTTTNHSIEIFTNSTSRWLFSNDGNLKANGAYGIHNLGGSGRTIPLQDGTNTIEFSTTGGQIFGHINGGGSILLG